MIKILYIIEATVGGTRKHINQLCKNLDRSKFDISLICSAQRDKSFLKDIEELRQLGIKAYVVPMTRSMNLFYDILAFLLISGIILKNRYDIVHTHSSKAGALGRPAAKIFGRAKIIHTPHTFSFLFKEEFGYFSRFLFLQIEKCLGLMTDRLIAITSEEKDIAINKKIIRKEKIDLIYNGVNYEEITATSAKEDILRRLGLEKNTPIIGTVGSLVHSKGHKYLICCLPDILVLFPGLKCVIVGDGMLKNELKNLTLKLNIEKSVLFTGYRSDYREILSIFDIFLMPSLWEGTSYVLLEAMAMEKPIIATRVGGFLDAVTDGKAGILVKPYDVKSLSGAIIELFKEPSKREALGRNALNRVKNSFRLKTMINQTKEIYANILNEV